MFWTLSSEPGLRTGLGSLVGMRPVTETRVSLFGLRKPSIQPTIASLTLHLFNLQPGFHSQRPIIVDEELESPDTVTLAYEEEAASGANGGGLSMSMSAYKPQPSQVHGESSKGQNPSLVHVVAWSVRVVAVLPASVGSAAARCDVIRPLRPRGSVNFCRVSTNSRTDPLHQAIVGNACKAGCNGGDRGANLANGIAPFSALARTSWVADLSCFFNMASRVRRISLLAVFASILLQPSDGPRDAPADQQHRIFLQQCDRTCAI